jgi:hypothetical protein
VDQKVHGSFRMLKIPLTYSYYLNGILLRTPENLVNQRISKRSWNKPELWAFPICTSSKRSRKAVHDTRPALNASRPGQGQGKEIPMIKRNVTTAPEIYTEEKGGGHRENRY